MTSPKRQIDRLMEVMETAFDPAYGEAWNRRQITDALAMPTTHAILIDAAGAVIEPQSDDPRDTAGFVLARVAPGEEELLLIAVRPEYRRQGLAEALIDHLFTAARKRGSEKIFLEMRRGNPAADLYHKAGFEPIGERPKYYRLINGERVDAITFGCAI